MDAASRIEEFAFEWLRCLVQQQRVMPLQLPLLAESNAHVSLCAEEGAPAAIVLGDKTQPRKLVWRDCHRD